MKTISYDSQKKGEVTASFDTLVNSINEAKSYANISVPRSFTRKSDITDLPGELDETLSHVKNILFWFDSIMNSYCKIDDDVEIRVKNFDNVNIKKRDLLVKDTNASMQTH